MNIDAMCIEAQTKLSKHINASAGQHIRALKSPGPSAPTSSDIYAMCCESDTSDQFARWLCAAAGVAYPPVNQGREQCQ